MENYKIAVLGSGSWATAIVKMFCENCEQVGWYVRNRENIEFIYQYEHNPHYLKSIEFDVEKLKISDDINDVVSNADVLILAIPSAYIEQQLATLTVDMSDKIVFSAIKGFVPESGLIVGEHLNKFYKVPTKNFGVIAGPCHAEEIGMERLSYLTLAAENIETAKQLKYFLESDFINIRVLDDIIGIEYAVALKNIFAVASGIAHGLGYGDNFQAVLVSNAAAEMKRFVSKVYKMKRNINASVYLGDLLVTCYSLFSRNRQLGNRIGKGYSLKSIFSEMDMIAEGYYASKSAYKIMKAKKIKAPILETVYHVLHEHKSPQKAIKELTEALE